MGERSHCREAYAAMGLLHAAIAAALELRPEVKIEEIEQIAIFMPEAAAAIVAEGLRRGTRRHRSIALGVATQFELTLRQVDVIGYWEKIDCTVGVDLGAIVDRGQVWRPGLRFEDFAAGKLDLKRVRRIRSWSSTSLPIRCFKKRWRACPGVSVSAG
jgi:hypothetical protein